MDLPLLKHEPGTIALAHVQPLLGDLRDEPEALAGIRCCRRSLSRRVGSFQQGCFRARSEAGRALATPVRGLDFRRWIRDRLDHGLGTRGVFLRKLGRH